MLAGALRLLIMYIQLRFFGLGMGKLGVRLQQMKIWKVVLRKDNSRCMIGAGCGWWYLVFLAGRGAGGLGRTCLGRKVWGCFECKWNHHFLEPVVVENIYQALWFFSVGSSHEFVDGLSDLRRWKIGWYFVRQVTSGYLLAFPLLLRHP